MKLNYNDINFIINEAVAQLMEEGIGINQFPKYGYCLILAGSPGSGKSFLLSNEIPIQGKVFDIDDFREKLTKMKGENVETKDAAILLRKSENAFLKAQGNIKNNIIFDICGRPEQRGKWSLFEEIVQMVKPLGYKIGVIWVAANRSVALKRNVSRKRTLPDKSIHQRTNQVNKFVPEFLSSNRANGIDEAWIVFSSGKNLTDTEIPKTISLEKTENGFNLTPEMKEYLSDFLGPKEKSNSWTPVTYLSNSEIKKLNDTPTTFLRDNSVNEGVLNESLSSIIYHFTTISKMVAIARTNMLILSSVSNNKNDIALNKGYPYYMSFTRERTSQTGYAAYMNGKYDHLLPKQYDKDGNERMPSHATAGQLYVRMEFDGDMLNNTFKGVPVDYHFKQNRHNKLQKVFSQSELVQFRQSEDRLLSKKFYIDNAHKFIKQIDIFYPENEIGNKLGTFELVVWLLKESIFKDIINVYTNINDFNAQNNTRTNDNDKIEAYFNDFRKPKVKQITNSRIGRLAAFLYVILQCKNMDVETLIDDVLCIYASLIDEEMYNVTKQNILKWLQFYENNPPTYSKVSLNLFKSDFSKDLASIYARTTGIYLQVGGKEYRSKFLPKGEGE